MDLDKRIKVEAFLVEFPWLARYFSQEMELHERDSIKVKRADFATLDFSPYNEQRVEYLDAQLDTCESWVSSQCFLLDGAGQELATVTQSLKNPNPSRHLWTPWRPQWINRDGERVIDSVCRLGKRAEQIELVLLITTARKNPRAQLYYTVTIYKKPKKAGSLLELVEIEKTRLSQIARDEVAKINAA